MKKLVFAFSVLMLCAAGTAQKEAETAGSATSLEERLATFMRLNEEMDLEGVMDYVYPKLFTIVPRNELLKAMKDAFNSEEVKVELDSMKVDKVYPVFEQEKGSYTKVTYSIVLIMDFNPSKDSIADKDDSQNELIRASMAEQFGEDNVSLDEVTGVLRVRTTSPMVAVKDELSIEWTFLNLKEEDPMMNKLFSKEVLDKLATYK